MKRIVFAILLSASLSGCMGAEIAFNAITETVQHVRSQEPERAR